MVKISKRVAKVKGNLYIKQNKTNNLGKQES